MHTARNMFYHKYIIDITVDCKMRNNFHIADRERQVGTGLRAIIQ